MTFSGAVLQAAERLEEAGVENARFDARCLLEHVTGENTTRLRLSDEEMSEHAVEAFNKAVCRRARGEPLQYILGEWEFMGTSFLVGEGVLIPRPETELLVEVALEKLQDVENPVVFDLCAGSGCVGLSIALARPDAKVYLFEKYAAAFEYLKENCLRTASSNSVPLMCDIQDGFESAGLLAPDIIVSNPPYIRSDDIPALEPEVRKEPVTALDGGEEGLDFYFTIASKWLPFVRPRGFAAVECDPQQALRVAGLFSAAAYRLRIIPDLEGRYRVVSADIY